MKTMLVIIASVSITLSITFSGSFNFRLLANTPTRTNHSPPQTNTDQQTFQTKQDIAALVKRSEASSQTCHRLRRQVNGLGQRINQQRKSTACSVQQANLGQLQAQAVVLQRTMNQLCGRIDVKASDIRQTACPENIQRLQQDLARLDEECGKASQTYASLAQRLLNR